VAVLAALAVAAIGRGALVAVATGVAVVAVRVAAEYLVPRGRKLELEDSFSAQDAVVRSSLDSTLASIHRRVPKEVEDGVASIRQNVLDILSREARLAAHSPELFVVLRTATDYMPTALQAYLRLPAGYATSRRQSDGKTALEILLEQLALLDREMVDVADAVTKQDLDRLRAHGRFLADRFGRSELTLADPETH
jgi:voltage-gated potassium channel Kch